MTDAIDTDDLDESELDAPLATDTRSQPLRYSVLKVMKQSAAHTRHAMLRGGGGWSRAKSSGSAVHAMVLGGADVRIAPELSDGVKDALAAIRSGADVRVYPGPVRRGKEWEKFSAENDGSVLVTAKENDGARSVIDLESAGAVLVSEQQYKEAQAMAAAVRANEVARRVLFQPGIICEQRIDWTWNGRAWRSTPDAYKFRTLAELKTTRCSDPAVFWRDALKLSYHVQLALYRRAIMETTGVKVRDVYLFAVESAPPYVVTPFKLSERSLEHGDMLAKRWHERFLQCEATGVWPGYTDGIEELDVYEQDDESAMEVERAMADDDGVRAAVSW